MAQLIRPAGALAGVLLAGAAMTPVPASARATTGRAVSVPCSGPALTTAIAAAVTVPVVLRLTPHCVYELAGELTVNGDVTLIGGPSTTVRRDPTSAAAFRVFDVSAGATLRVRGISILNGDPASPGGGIRNAGTLVLTFVTLSGNTSTGADGGGVANLTTGRALIADSVLTSNRALDFGGGLSNAGTVTLLRSRVAANIVQPNSGGGVGTETGGTTHIVQSTIDHNFAQLDGGGINNRGGVVTLDRTLVTANRSVDGGGIFNNLGLTTLRASIVRANTPNDCAPANSVPHCAG